MPGAFADRFAHFALGPGPAAEQVPLTLTPLAHERDVRRPEGGDYDGLPHLSYADYLAGCHLSPQADFCTRAADHW